MMGMDCINQQTAQDRDCSHCIWHTDGRCASRNCEYISRKEALEALEKVKAMESAQPEIEERMSETEQNVPNDDFISRKRAIDAIEAVFPVDPMKSEYAQGIACGAALSKTYIEQLPSAQPEIVRCKYCKFWREHKYAKYAKGTKRYIPFCGLNAIYTKSDDFCSKGERRTDEQT